MEPIPVYELFSNNFERLDVKMYPVVSGGDIVAFICDTEEQITLSMSFVDEINDVYHSAESSICVVYDRFGVYLWNGNQLRTLHEYSDVTEFAYRGTLSPETSELLYDLSGSCLEPKMEISIAQNEILVCSDDTMYCYISVPL